MALIATADWAVRTRRINPFGGVARFLRANVDPRLAGVERQVLRAGGHPSATPWWALVAYVVIAALVLAALDMLFSLLAPGDGGHLAGSGRNSFPAHPLGVRVPARCATGSSHRLLVSRAAASRWMRWSFGATEWMLGPLRRVIPSIGMMDITPIVAYFALYLLEGLFR